ncbi:MAG: hypothetical protein HOV97_37540 [Nonomuraea sp.]|nr:hypothetical protein [Nonomuraea sp.]NUS08268.1 hypothetical protein [Nonomuraea sp.]
MEKATSGRAPVAEVSGPAPVQADDSVGVPPTEWWESAFVQLMVAVLFLVGFGGYPVVAAIRRVRGRGTRNSRPGTTSRHMPSHGAEARGAEAVGVWLGAARVVSTGGLGVLVGGFAYLFYLMSTGGKLAVPGPVLMGRPVIWVVLQLLAVATVVATALTVPAWRRAGATGRTGATGERVRLGLLLTAGVLFVPWAFYWGLLLP